MNLPFSRLIVRFFLLKKLFRQHHVLKSRILWEKIKRLKYKSEVKTFSPNLTFLACLRIRSVKQRLPVHTDYSAVRLLQKIQAAQQRRLSTTG